MRYRTDLATETVAVRGDLTAKDLRKTEEKHGKYRVTRVQICTERGERLLGKPQGRYVTVTLPSLPSDTADSLFPARLIAAELTALLPPEGPVLVAGLGNPSLTADSLGPLTAARVVATRDPSLETAVAGLRPTAVTVPDVCGKTGMDAAEQLRGLCDRLRPVAVIAVDALAAVSIDHLGKTVQITDVGLAPGSGVGERRCAVNHRTLGVPVIGIGVPTVVDARCLIADLTGLELSEHHLPTMNVTPQDIDLRVRRAARLLALGIHAALYPDLPPDRVCALAE